MVGMAGLFDDGGTVWEGGLAGRKGEESDIGFRALDTCLDVGACWCVGIFIS